MLFRSVTFSSGKTVSHTVQLLQERYGSSWATHLKQAKVVSIGPQTSKRCKDLLGRVDQEADPHDIEGLVQACVQTLVSSSPSSSSMQTGS